MDTRIRLRRAMVGYVGIDRLDVTVRSADAVGRPFTPTWAMVRSLKAGRIGREQYSLMYRQILGRLPYAGAWLDELLAFGHSHDGRLTVVCYCPNGAFCHTHLLIDWLVEHYGALFADAR